MYNKSTAPISSDTPQVTFAIPSGGNVYMSELKMAFAAGCGLRCTTAAADADVGAPDAEALLGHVVYRLD